MGDRVEFPNLTDGITTTFGDELDSRLNALKAEANIALCWLGDYDAETTYYANDVVNSANKLWRAKREMVDVTPVEGDDWTDFLGNLEFSDTLLVIGGDNNETTWSGGVQQIVRYGDGSTLGGGILLGHAGGTKASPTALPSGHRLGILGWLGWDGSAWKTAAGIIAKALGTFAGGENGTAIDIEATPKGSTTRQVVARFSAPNTLTDAATIAVDAAHGDVHRVTITASRTIGNPTNAYDGQVLQIEVKQNGTGGWEPTLDTKFVLPDDLAAIPWQTDANATTILWALYNAGADKFRVVDYQLYAA